SYTYLFVNHTAATEIYTLSLHDALPISFDALNETSHCTADSAGSRFAESSKSKPRFSRLPKLVSMLVKPVDCGRLMLVNKLSVTDRKSTRLNSSHVKISYAVFCLKKKTI